MNLNYTKSNKKLISYIDHKKKKMRLHKVLQFLSMSFLTLKLLYGSIIINAANYISLNFSWTFHFCLKLPNIFVCTQPLLNGSGLGLGSQLTCRVGLVFPIKGNSSPSDTMTSLNPSEHTYFPLYVALSPGFTSSLSLSLFSLQNCQPLLLILLSYL